MRIVLSARRSGKSQLQRQFFELNPFAQQVNCPTELCLIVVPHQHWVITCRFKEEHAVSIGTSFYSASKSGKSSR